MTLSLGGCYGLCLVHPEGRSCACEEYSTVDKHGIKCGKYCGQARYQVW